MKSTTHSWPRRSGKTTSAIGVAEYLRIPYYSCGFIPKGFKIERLVTTLKDVQYAVIDNYEHASPKEKALISKMTDSHLYGTFGSEADDYRIGGKKEAKAMRLALEEGVVGWDMALRDFMNI